MCLIFVSSWCCHWILQVGGVHLCAFLWPLSKVPVNQTSQAINKWEQLIVILFWWLGGSEIGDGAIEDCAKSCSAFCTNGSTKLAVETA